MIPCGFSEVTAQMRLMANVQFEPLVFTTEILTDE